MEGLVQQEVEAEELEAVGQRHERRLLGADRREDVADHLANPAEHAGRRLAGLLALLAANLLHHLVPHLHRAPLLLRRVGVLHARVRDVRLALGPGGVVVDAQREQREHVLADVDLQPADAQHVDAQVELAPVDQQRPRDVPLHDPLAQLGVGPQRCQKRRRRRNQLHARSAVGEARLCDPHRARTARLAAAVLFRPLVPRLPQLWQQLGSLRFQRHLEASAAFLRLLGQLQYIRLRHGSHEARIRMLRCPFLRVERQLRLAYQPFADAVAAGVEPPVAHRLPIHLLVLAPVEPHPRPVRTFALPSLRRRRSSDSARPVPPSRHALDHQPAHVRILERDPRGWRALGLDWRSRRRHVCSHARARRIPLVLVLRAGRLVGRLVQLRPHSGLPPSAHDAFDQRVWVHLLDNPAVHRKVS